MNLKITSFYSNDNVTSCPQFKKPEYAFIGRSNVGKSSLINLILGQKLAYTSSKPGKTQLINHFFVNEEWAFVDLPGYGYAKISKKARATMLQKTEKYFKHRGINLVAVFMLIDIRIPPQKIDIQRMNWLVENNIYFIRVFTKCDQLRQDQTRKYLKNYDNYMIKNNWGKIPDSITTSSKKKIGRDKILEHIFKLNKLFQDL